MKKKVEKKKNERESNKCYTMEKKIGKARDLARLPRTNMVFLNE